jgi:hypothetical protein
MSILTTRDRDKNVMTSQRGLLPILIPVAEPKQADGMTFLDGGPVYGRLLPPEILEVFEVQNARRALQKRYGRIANSQWAGLKAAIALLQATEKRDPRYLRDYITAQASAEVFEEEELIERMSSLFVPEARKAFASMQATVRELEKRTWSEEAEKLKKRTIATGRLAPHGELLLQLNRWVRGARFVMYLDRKQARLLPGLYCPDPGTGLAALIFNRVPTPKGLAVCRRASCRKSFLRTRSGQQYCSLRCGNADRKARERRRAATRSNASASNKTKQKER